MKYLIKVAHPDDEVLGVSHQIDVSIKCTEANARAFRLEDKELDDDSNASASFLSVHKKYEATFPDIEMNTVPHTKLVQFIEIAIKEDKPDVSITHYPADTNNDHLVTSMACQESIRLFQHRPEVKHVKKFWYMEVPSCTERAVKNAMCLLRPNGYVEVGKEGVDAKFKACSMYQGVIRPYPHPRIEEYTTCLNAMRGGQWGQNYAESFKVVLKAK